VALADDHASLAGTRRALLEVSGGITLEKVGTYADTGADVVSSGSLTNSAPVLDIGLDIEVHRT
jgi:nicotinate-nucleotide pyrophosphorylase (carboxylating)